MVYIGLMKEGLLDLTGPFSKEHLRPFKAEAPADTDGDTDYLYQVFFNTFFTGRRHEFDFFAGQVPDDYCSEGVIVGRDDKEVIIFPDHLDNFFTVINGG